MAPTRVLVLFNEPHLPVGHPDFESEHEIRETAEAVAGHLADAGFDVERLGIGEDVGALVDLLRGRRPDVVFNLFEGLAGQGHTEASVAGLLEWAGLPFTGCPALAITLARAKELAKLALKGAELPTPAFAVADSTAIPAVDLVWPLIVKPAHEDASVGLDQGSVVTDQHSLEERVALVLDCYGPPVLVEEFIDGRELNVAVVETPELRVLPPGEIEFRGAGGWKILTYEAKWRPGSAEDEATPARYPAEVDPVLGARLSELAARAFRLLGCRDYARVDFRVRADGRPFVLEVNPNPGYHPTAGLVRALESAGIRHAEFSATLVRNALGRAQAPRLQPGGL